MPWKALLQTGWRRAALFNTIGVLAFTLFALILLIWSSSRTGGVNTNLIFFEGGCSRSQTINLWLHLLLNVFSTGVLASSNFFMQVLSSPTRSELDKAHCQRLALKLGVSSPGNLVQLPLRNKLFWLLFLVSSLPIHLFFNSALFATEYKGAGWHLTIASEGFSYGAQYFNPGAVLWPAGAPLTQYEWVGNVQAGYGTIANESEYWNASSQTSRSIQFAAESSRDWKRLEVADCLSEFVYCSPHNQYRDVVWVVQSHNTSYMNNTSTGWHRGDIIAPWTPWDAIYSQWNETVPAKANNSLWFAANCSTTVFFNIEEHQAQGCYQSCSGATGNDTQMFVAKPASDINSTYTFDFLPYLDHYSSVSLKDIRWPGLVNKGAANLDLQYCLVQETSPVCKVGLSNKLLLVVVICTTIKTILCVLVLVTLPREEPLVVLGDAIASFIHTPDATTSGRGTMDLRLAQQLGRSPDYRVLPAGPRQWHVEPDRRWIPNMEKFPWYRDYLLFILDILFLGAFFGVAQRTNPIGNGGQTLSESVTNGILSTGGGTASTLISSVITANLPQLLLSISYFAYNSLFTRLCAEKEWTSYGRDYHPLRVSHPKGKQRSTYRLQLPYRYSVPIIIISIILHWLVSNALYVFILEGGYYWVSSDALKYYGTQPTSPAGSGLSDDAYIGIGYSTVALLSLLIAAIVLPLIPLFLSQSTIRSRMPIAGSNSLVISAACHVPVIDSLMNNESRRSSSESTKSNRARSNRTSGNGRDTQGNTESRHFEMQSLLSPADPRKQTSDATENCSEEKSYSNTERFLIDVSRNPVRWGVVRTPESWNEQYAGLGHDVGHLSFGSRSHEVQEPSNGRWYA